MKKEIRGDIPCADCGTDENIVWFTENVFWNAVMREDLRHNQRTKITGEMKYPRLPIELDARYKVLPKYTEEMRQMHEDGISFRNIAKAFGLKSKDAVMQRLYTPQQKRRLLAKYKARREKIKKDLKLKKILLRYYKKHRKKKYRLQHKEMRVYDKSKGH